MAMNKAEKEQVEQLKFQLALRWTQPVLKDVPIPKAGLSTGYMFAGARGDYARVDVACSSVVHHGFGYSDKTTSQQPMELYSSRLLALKALRHESEKYCASILRRIDKQIEDEGSKVAMEEQK